MALPAALEADVKDLRAKMKTTAEDEARFRDEADKLVEAKKKANPNVNLVEDAEAFAEIQAAYEKADEAKEAVAAFQERIASLVGVEAAEQISRAGEDMQKAQSIAQRLIDAEAYQILVNSGVLNTGAPLTMAGVNIMDVDEAIAALAPGSIQAATTSGAPLVPSDRNLYPPIMIPQRQVRLLDLINVGSTGSDTVEWTRQTARNNNVANTAFGTASPESDYVWEKVTETVKRVVHHATVTRGNLADQGQMRTLINGELTGDLRRHVENQVLSGDGTGENVTGILNTVGIGSQAKAADTIPDAIHKGITIVRIQLEDDITAIGVHPNDYERLVLAKDGDNRYLTGEGWQSGTPRTIWGYPAIVSTLFTEGVAVPANWFRGATLWVREGISVSASSEHASNFTEGLVTVQAETRAAFAAKQPRAFAQVTGLNA